MMNKIDDIPEVMKELWKESGLDKEIEESLKKLVEAEEKRRKIK